MDLDDLDPDPHAQFERWFDEAAEAGVRAPEQMALATATPEGAPSVRMVLLKGHDERGFVFYTNRTSRKAAEIDANPRAAAALYWELQSRQVRIEGPVERITRRGVVRLLPDAATREPDQRVGLAPVPAGRRQGRARAKCSPDRGAVLR